VSTTVVLALFRDKDLAIPRHAANSSSMELLASSYASALVRVESLVHSKPRLAVELMVRFSARTAIYEEVGIIM
jgi:hypothetical protein